MKGYIDEYGRLWIWRKKEYIMVECRESHNNYPCNQRCSRFEEPYSDRVYTYLDLCTKTLKFKIFEDKR